VSNKRKDDLSKEMKHRNKRGIGLFHYPFHRNFRRKTKTRGTEVFRSYSLRYGREGEEPKKKREKVVGKDSIEKGGNEEEKGGFCSNTILKSS